MARYQVILAYDGTGFVGSQRQASPFGDGATGLSPGAKRSRTVQNELEKALYKLGWSGRSVLLAGRTDTGVHATGQVAAFDLDWQHADGDLLRALNANLPADMAARDVRVVPPKFHPRFDATSRRYRYRLFCQPVRHPLREKSAWRVWPRADGEALKKVATLFVGQHDFAAYGTPPRAGSSTLRTVMNAFWQAKDDEWHFEVQANAFLYRMVRRLVFVQVAVAQGKTSVEAVARSLAGQADSPVRSELPAGLAPAHGLTLVEVTYPPESSGS
ncbi:MAG: tRNA pseudouridine(38-40) synthase TruA [Anaerolineales bacterium]|nr:tRNA pseudouridine(38-40) synthase TruA [Anaerolineales bacterium]